MLRIDFNLVLTIINLIVLYLILRKFLFRPVMDIMEKREKMIADGIGHANEEQDKAHALKKQYEDALNGAKEESTKMIEQAKLDAKQEYNQILNEANEKADKVMKTARESLNQEREQAFDDMKAQVAGLAMDAAKKILPVRHTFVPCLISESSPNRIQLISFSLMSCTMPLRPVSNVTISPYIAWSIPYTEAIPSPTEMTVPTS